MRQLLLWCTLVAAAAHAVTPEEQARMAEWKQLFSKSPEGFQFSLSPLASTYGETSYNDLIAACGVALPVELDASLLQAFPVSTPSAAPAACDAMVFALKAACAQDELGKATVRARVTRVVCKGSTKEGEEAITLKDGVLTYLVGPSISDLVTSRGNNKREIFLLDVPSTRPPLTLEQARQHQKAVEYLEQESVHRPSRIKEDCGLEVTVELDPRLVPMLGEGTGAQCESLLGAVHGMCKPERQPPGMKPRPPSREKQQLIKAAQGIKAVACRSSTSVGRAGKHAFRQGVLSLERGAEIEYRGDTPEEALIRAVLQAGR